MAVLNGVLTKGLLMLVLLALLQGCKTDLYTNLSERDANSMVAELLRRGISAERVVQKDGHLTVKVDEARFAEAMHILDEAGLPGQSFANLGEVFKSNGLVSSPVQERAQMIYALSEELSHTVSQVDGVLSARVHVVLPDNDLLKRKVTPSSASVFIRYEPGMDINPLIPQIKTLVANGISGLAYENVSVVPVEAIKRVDGVQEGEPLVSFMGLWMLQSDVSKAAWMMGGLLFLVVALAASLMYALWQSRRTQTYELVSLK
jgi:type III secretion protein J